MVTRIRVNITKSEFDSMVVYPGTRNPVVKWLSENISPVKGDKFYPCCGEGWKCWMAFSPHEDFKITYCLVEFDDVPESIISMFAFRWA